MIEEHSPKVCGTTTVGERGQVVIPAEIRKRMNLKRGDRLLVFCRFDQMIGLIRSDDLDQFISRITEHIANKIKKFKKGIKRDL